MRLFFSAFVESGTKKKEKRKVATSCGHYVQYNRTPVFFPLVSTLVWSGVPADDVVMFIQHSLTPPSNMFNPISLHFTLPALFLSFINPAPFTIFITLSAAVFSADSNNARCPSFLCVCHHIFCQLNFQSVICLFFSQVNHSQRLRDPPLKTWILACADGIIITAHCTCMAGVGEASHTLERRCLPSTLQYE